MADKTLVEFVKESLERGEDKSRIAGALGEAGWRNADIDAALASFSDVAFPVAVPHPRPYLSAREAFFYLVFFILLGIVAFSLGSLLFALINQFLPDNTDLSDYRRVRNASSIRSGIAGLIVATPLFIWLARTLVRTRQRNPELQRSRIRKWLIYASLVIAAITLIGDAISVIYNFLSGEMTLRFILKALVVGLIAGSIFTYFIRDAEKGDEGA